MLGKPEWFQRRKYTGWGLTPAKWQGWAYIIVMVVPVFALNQFYSGPREIWLAAMGAWTLFFILDALDIMAKLKKDEREAAHEALAERNVAWFMVLVLAVGFAFEIASGAAKGMLTFNPFIAAALFGGLIIKAATNWHLERKD